MSLAGRAGEREAERRALDSIAAATGLALAPSQLDALQAHLDLLEQWNATYNLTAVRDRGAMLHQHLADCLAAAGSLLRRAGGGRLLDVGSGGGLPGAVIAIAAPGWDVTCVDRVAKKAAFVRQLAARLGLANLRAEHARVEALRAPPFDVVTARALGSLADLVRWTQPLLAPGGVWMAMKGRRPDDEMTALPASAEVFHVERLSVPGLDAQRCLVWMRPCGAAA